MAFEDLKDQLKDQLHTVKGRIEESAAWQDLVERYQGLSPNGQKAALGGVGALGGLLVLSFLWMFFSSSVATISEFEDKKELMRELYHYAHVASTLPPSPPPISAADLKMAIQGVLSSQNPPLLADQTVSLLESENKPTKSPALPGGLTQSAVDVSLSRLNLDQVVNIGGKLQELRPTAKMTGLRVQANAQDPHYFDVSFKMVAFSLPAPAEIATPGKTNNKKSPGTAKPGNKN